MTLPILPSCTLGARLVRCLIADGEGFVTRPVPGLDLTLDGIPDDRHQGPSHGANGRTPWYARGTPIRNERHVSLVSVEELALVREALALPMLDAAWLGANLVLEGLGHVSFLPRGTRLHAPSGAALVITDQNAPCRVTGRALQAQFPERQGLDVAFPKAARRARGLVAAVERAGRLEADMPLRVHVPEQWLYHA